MNYEIRFDNDSESSCDLRREAITGAIHTLSKTSNSAGSRPRLKDSWSLLDMLYTIQKDNDEGHNDHIPLAEFRADFVFSIHTDRSNGKIQTLGLGSGDLHHQGEAFRLPGAIEKLTHLKELTLYRCGSIPIELGHLPALESLEIFNSFHGRVLMPEDIRLPHLKKLSLEWTEFCRYSSIVSKPNALPVLEELIVRPSPIPTTSGPWYRFFQILKDDKRSFRTSLRRLDLHRCKIGEKGLECLLWDVLPNFPNLRELDVTMTGIKSLRIIQDRLLQKDSPLSSGRLKTLGLAYNPFLYNAKSHCHRVPEGSEALTLMDLLWKYSEVSSLGYRDTSAHGPQIEYLLRINAAGRKYLVHDDDDDYNDDHCTTNLSKIPPGLWPIILERAYRKDRAAAAAAASRGCSPTSIYYVLRNASVVHDIVAINETGTITTREKRIKFMKQKQQQHNRR